MALKREIMGPGYIPLLRRRRRQGDRQTDQRAEGAEEAFSQISFTKEHHRRLLAIQEQEESRANFVRGGGLCEWPPRRRRDATN